MADPIRSGPPPPPDSSKHLFDLKKLRKIAKAFGVSVSRLTHAELQIRCFSHVVSACEQRKWTKIRAINASLEGLTDLAGNAVLDVCVENDLTSTVTDIRDQGYINTLSGPCSASALNKGAQKGNEIAVQILLDNGWDIEHTDSQGKTPLLRAIEGGHSHLVEQLIENDANLHSLHKIVDPRILHTTPTAYSVKYGEEECLKVLIADLHALANDAIKEIGNLLHVAIFYRQQKIFRLLLTEFYDQAHSFIEERNEDGQTPLCMAAETENLEAIYFLVAKKGANINGININGRTPLHCAARMGREHSISLLAHLGSCFTIKDTLLATPYNLASSKKTQVLLQNLEDLKKEEKKLPPNFSKYSPENLVFEGGGPKGVAYVGVIQILEEHGLLHEVRRVAGTSAGAITATLLALGCSSHDIRQLLEEIPMNKFLDSPSLDKFISAWKTSSKLQLVINAYKVGTTVFNKLGACTGTFFFETIEKIIYEKTGIRYCTFGEFSSLINTREDLKHLHVFATKLGSKSEIVRLSSENDENSKNIVIASAVRASMSIPVVFEPHVLLVKDPITKTVTPDPSRDLHIDGGLLANLPLEEFDKQKYQASNLGKFEESKIISNPRTLAFHLYSPINEKDIDTKPIKTIGELFIRIITTYYNGESLIRKYSNSFNTHRIVKVDHLGTALLDFDPAPGKQQALIASGRKSTEALLTKNISSLQVLLRPTNVHGQLRDYLPPRPEETIRRQTAFNALYKKLVPSTWKISKNSTECAVLYGHSGTGKSDIALDFAYENLSRFSLVYWLDCHDEDTMRLSLYRLAQEGLEIELKEDETLDFLRNKVIDHLEQKPFKLPWLLVQDDLQDSHQVVLPKTGGVVLITSTTAFGWETSIEKIPIDVLSDWESLQLCEKIVPQEDGVATLQLVQALHKVPEALSYAAAYMRHTGLSAQKCLEMVEGEIKVFAPAFLEDHTSFVQAIYQVTIKHLQAHESRAATFLRCCAFLSSTGIPLNWLETWLSIEERRPASTTRSRAKEIIEALRKYHFIRYDEKSNYLYINNLLREVLQKESQREVSYRQASDLVWEMYSQIDFDFSDIYVNLRIWLGQAHSILTNELIDSLEKNVRALFLTKLAYCFIYSGFYSQALMYEKKALKLIKEAFPNQNHRDIAFVCTQLGFAYEKLNQFVQARKCYVKACNIYQNLYSGTDSSTNEYINSYMRLAAIDNILSKYTSALNKLQKIELKLSLLPEPQKHSQCIIFWNEKGRAYRGLGKYEKAYDCANQAYQVAGKSDSNLITAALAVLTSALPGQRFSSIATALSLSSPHLWNRQWNRRVNAQLLHNLADIDFSIGRYREALLHFQQASQEREELHHHCPGHPESVESQIGIGKSLTKLGDYLEARRTLLRVFRLCQLGRININTILYADGLTVEGELSLESGQFLEEGIKSLIEAREIYESLFSSKFHHRVAYITHCKGALQLRRREYRQAIEDLTEAATIYDELYPNTNQPEKAMNAKLSGDAFYALGQWQNAIDKYTIASELYEEHRDALRHREVLWSLRIARLRIHPVFSWSNRTLAISTAAIGALILGAFLHRTRSRKLGSF